MRALSNRGDYAMRIAIRADTQYASAPVHVPVKRPIYHRRYRFPQAIVMDIRDDPGNLIRACGIPFVIEAQPAADGCPPWEEAASERFIHNRHTRQSGRLRRFHAWFGWQVG